MLYHLAFSHFLGIGPIRFLSLIKKFSSAKAAYQAKKDELKEVLGEKLAEKFILFKEKFNPKKTLEEIEKKGVKVIPYKDKLYPSSFLNIADPPICLYAKGDISLLENNNKKIFFAIVGTRKPTSYGEKMSKKFAYELAQAGISIVSGMAYGVDALSHQACLEAGEKTVAVLGCGVNIVYPANNLFLYKKIINQGLVLSEFPPDQMVSKGLFIARNRLISALSQGVLVVEGGEDSGSLITARYAIEQGKDVFAIPSPINSSMSFAPNFLLKQGAKLVASSCDIFDELKIKITPKKEKEIEVILEEKEKSLFEILLKKPMLVDEISLSLKKPVSEVLNILSIMELKGVVEKTTGNLYQIKTQYLR